jgi:hypothetical protein
MEDEFTRSNLVFEMVPFETDMFGSWMAMVRIG